MAKNVTKIAEALGATVVGEVPETGGGAFGMRRLAAILRTRLVLRFTNTAMVFRL